jgi:hypothetical protein
VGGTGAVGQGCREAMTTNYKRGWIKAAMIMIVGGSVWGMSSRTSKFEEASSPMPQLEYRVKAGFLYYFAQFTEWPKGTFADTEEKRAPVRLCVLGSDPFGTMLEDTLKDRLVDGRAIEIVRAKTLEEAKGCHVLFISSHEKDRIAELLAKLPEGPVLTVSETPGFAKQGGMVNFYVENGRVLFEVNRQAIHARKLSLSSKLLRLAKIVDGEPVAPVEP